MGIHSTCEYGQTDWWLLLPGKYDQLGLDYILAMYVRLTGIGGYKPQVSMFKCGWVIQSPSEYSQLRLVDTITRRVHLVVAGGYNQQVSTVS